MLERERLFRNMIARPSLLHPQQRERNVLREREAGPLRDARSPEDSEGRDEPAAPARSAIGGRHRFLPKRDDAFGPLRGLFEESDRDVGVASGPVREQEGIDMAPVVAQQRGHAFTFGRERDSNRSCVE